MEAVRDLRAPPVRTRRALLAVAAAAAALAGTLTAAATGTGGGSVPAASSIVASRDVTVLRRAELERIGPRRAAAGAVASAKSAKLSYYTTVNFETVVPGGDELYEIRCPARRQPLTGGVLSATPGLAISNSSRVSPDPDRPTLSGAWYEGVVNLTATTLQWKPSLVCVRS